MSRLRAVATPTILQMEATECGAVCLAIILGRYGRWVPLASLREDCGVNRNGSRASNLLKAARKHGLDAETSRMTADQALNELAPPAIIHWEQSHFVVYEGVKRGRVRINDPGFGHRSLTRDEFRESFSGTTMRLTAGPDFKREGRAFSVVREVAAKLVRDKAALAFVLLASLFLILPATALPVVSQVFLDDVLAGSHRDWLWTVVFALAVIGCMTLVLTGLRSWCLTRWQNRLTVSESSRFLNHVLRLPVSFFQQRFSGEIAMRVQFNESVANVLTGSMATALLDLATAAFFLVVLALYSWKLTLIGVFFTLVNLALLSAARRHLRELALRVQQDTGKMLAAGIGGLQGIETIKANGNENAFFSRWSGLQENCLAGRQRLEVALLMLNLAPSFFGAVNTALIMLVGGFQIMDGLMTVGVFIAFQGVMGNFQAPVNKTLSLSRTLQDTEMQMLRLDDVMTHPEAELPDVPAGPRPSRLGGRLDVRDLRFGYSPLDSPFIPDLDLSLEPGKRLALVGSSGCGKSTVANLVGGLLEPWSGTILFDGKPRVEINRDVFANSVSVVSQDTRLFTASVRENISLFNPSLREADLVRACRDAEIHEDIAGQRGGYGRRLTDDGGNLSGGQRQRLAIARALAVNPSLLILDEATSALDAITEGRIFENIRRRGCACLIVAHRLSAFRDCDEILVMDWGRVVERGSHDSMMRRDGPYARLVSWASAAEKSASASGGQPGGGP